MTRRRLTATVAAVVAVLALAACGGSSSTPQATLHSYLTAWSHGDWAAMRKLVATPPATFTTANAAAFTALGVKTATFSAGRVTQKGSKAHAGVTQSFALPLVGAWRTSTVVHLVQRNGIWKVAWTPATINPALHGTQRLASIKDWPSRAGITGAGGAPLLATQHLVNVGLVGGRIKNAGDVSADLLAAGATPGQVKAAVAQAKAHPTFFEPVFQISQARFEQLKAQPGAHNVYSVPGTQFQATTSRSAITPQLAAHLVGTVGPITADQLKALGPPYDSSSQVGQTGLEYAAERQLAGTPTTKVIVETSSGALVKTLASFPGKPGQPLRTTLDPRVQRAAESALSGVHKSVAMVAIRASTGQVLAAVSDPASTGYNTAFQGAYPPGSTFKVLTSAMLIRNGLSPSSPASCPPSITIDGEVFHNAEGDQPVSSIDAAFTESCNTAFIGLATAHLHASDFPAIATLFGLGRSPHLGLTAFDANVPAPSGQADLAASAIGQGRVTFSPLGMATVAAAVDSSSVRAPRLVVGAPDDRIAPSPLPGAVVNGLRLMMGHVVASGTAAGTGLPAGAHAKTGTAQYGSGGTLKLDAWLMGYDGDIAFAIVVQNSGGVNGGPLDGPIIAKFFDALGPTAGA
ncbi:MAG TPA: penicillin-binding transpeptidase domain-containing protein [Solirubrobacteraceae bacterium]|nr:penicillin-binding transpeptidase domain-containing protein [Solirubrobacteraceae bacterium]